MVPDGAERSVQMETESKKIYPCRVQQHDMPRPAAHEYNTLICSV